MTTKKVVLCLIVFTYIFSCVNNAHAQFWRKWFQKDQKAEEPLAGEKAQPETKQEETPTQRYRESMRPVQEGAGGVDVEIWTTGEPEDTPGQAVKEAGVALKTVPAAPPATPAREMDEKQRQEELRRTQEQVDQIKKLQEMNNIQRSLDSIKRINEMNQQQKRIDEINRLNRMQRNLDDLRRMQETKK